MIVLTVTISSALFSEPFCSVLSEQPVCGQTYCRADYNVFLMELVQINSLQIMKSCTAKKCLSKSFLCWLVYYLSLVYFYTKPFQEHRSQIALSGQVLAPPPTWSTINTRMSCGFHKDQPVLTGMSIQICSITLHWGDWFQRHRQKGWWFKVSAGNLYLVSIDL